MLQRDRGPRGYGRDVASVILDDRWRGFEWTELSTSYG